MFDDNLVCASSPEQYASDFPLVSSIPRESSPSAAASAECRTLPVEGKFIMK